MKRVNKILSVFLAIAIIFTTAPFSIMTDAAGSQSMTEVDDSTHHHWHEDLEHSTKEIGRIWTDKTVWNDSVVYPYEHQFPNQLGVNKGDSDFLVELSALSSAATVTGKVSTALPLDIVIVMDTSGSMDYSMPSGTYELLRQSGRSVSYSDLYSWSNNGSVYYKIGEEYVKINATRTGSIYNRRYTISYQAPGATTLTYIASNASNSNFTLAYSLYQEQTTTRLEALKDSVNAFINETKAKNDTISARENKHRIALVEFASSSQKLIDLTYVDSDTNVRTLTRAVNGLDATGATGADLGMATAREILIGRNSQTRSSAKKVVIFFTDGTPTTYNTFSDSVANGAIANAKDLKDEDTVIYTIGVYEEADPSDLTQNFNQYMHGVSSNYPNAQAYTNLGTRAASSNYYLSAEDSGSLNKVFSDILEEVTSLKASAATQVQEGNEGASGYITFVDPLGKYMQVDDFKAISFAENNYTNPAKVTNGNITTYTFTGVNQDNPIYPTTGNLNQIVITVEKSADLSVGDVVTVKIPGALIPIHYYEVYIDENGNITMTEDHTLPIRVWYGVSVKPEVETALETPDAELKAYIDANKDASGEVLFYSNLYEQGSQTVYSTFEPNQKNNFYFYQNDEYLFTDFACTNPATSLEANKTYYYQRDYYNPKNSASYEGEAEKLVNTIAIPGSSGVILAGYAKRAGNGQYYVPKGTPRTTSIVDYAVVKADNVTETSENAIKPSWLNVMNNPTTVQNELGNNGIIKMAVPGTLAVRKLVTADAGLTAPANNQFTFQIELTAPQGETLKESYAAQIVAKDGTLVGNAFEFKPATNKTVTLVADQTVYIYGLTAGTTYRVTETNLPDGFEKVGTAAEEGEIRSGTTSQVTVTNNYDVTPISLTGTELGLTGTKILDGRPFKAGDSFEFLVSATLYSPNAPLPSGAPNGSIKIEPTAGNSSEFALGTFTFQKPGEYHYEIREKIPSQGKIVGVSYDATIYRVVITIVDNGEGELALGYLEINKNDPATSRWISLYEGAALPSANADYLKFTNTYSEDTEEIIIRGTKTLDGKRLADYDAGTFKFVIKAAGSKVAGSEDAFADDNTQPMPSDTIVSATSTGDIIFPSIEFTSNSVGKEYKYIITEYQPTVDGSYNETWLEGVTQDENFNFVYKGVTYSKEEREVIIKVQSVPGDGIEIIAPEVEGNQFNFVNKYSSSPVRYEILGEKNITGRNFKQGDEFKFEITAVNGAPQPVDDVVTIRPASGNKKDFSLGTIWFDHSDVVDGETVPGSSARVKTFTYKLREVDLKNGGFVYDTAERTLTIEVKDLDGKTEITSVKLDGEALTARIAWNNQYSASTTYGGMNVIKTMKGKAISQGEFSFKITAEAGAPEIAESDKLFSTPIDAYYNPASDSASVVMPKLSGIKFEHDDAGKTFSYILEEVVPTQTGKVTYDKSQYRVELKPYDNGDGTMGVQTVITQIADAQGNTITNGQKAEFDSKNATVPNATFTNSYDVEEGVLDGATKLLVTKTFLGREWNTTDAFKFELALAEGEASAVTMPSETVITINKDTADYTKAFGDILFSEPGIYVFTVKEQTPDGGKKDGITYDTNISRIVVEVTNDGSGVYAVNIKSADTLTFVNVYAVGTGTSAVISGEKEFNGTLVDGDYTFELYPANENFEVLEEPETKINENGEFSFSLSYEPTDVGKTFYYVLKEENAGQTIEGIYYDDTEYHITIEIADDGVGGARAIQTVTKGEDEVTEVIEFYNEYKVRSGASIELSGTKTLNGRDIEDGEFTFQLYSANSEFVADQVVASAVNTAEQFTVKVDYLPEDAGRTLYYVLREKNAGTVVEGVDYDATEYYVTVNLQDNGDGTMTAVKTVMLGEEVADAIEFTNEYSAAEETVTIQVKKKLEGRDLEADEFTFKLYSADSQYAYDENGLLQTIKNTASGEFEFEELVFEETGIYYYVVVEEASEESEGITFDESVYLIMIEVKDNGKGELVAENLKIAKKGVEGTVEEISFKNIYTPQTTPDPTPTPDPDEPKTGDDRNLLLWVALLVVSCFGFVVINLKTKKAERGER